MEINVVVKINTMESCYAESPHIFYFIEQCLLEEDLTTQCKASEKRTHRIMRKDEKNINTEAQNSMELNTMRTFY